MGYVLVWAQISFWAAVVITSLLSVIPVFGSILVSWVWGGFRVSSATLKFFFVLHFLLPWFLLVLVGLHLLFLHSTGRTSKIFINGDFDKINFFVFYWSKDGVNFFFWILFFLFCFIEPFLLGDPEIFLVANPITSPVHIVPEWYFLFAYAILRAIPNKIVGVLFLLLSILIFYCFLFFGVYLSPLDQFNKILLFFFFFCSLLLSWLGQCVVEHPFLLLSFIFFLLYFFLIIVIFFNYFVVMLLFD